MAQAQAPIPGPMEWPRGILKANIARDNIVSPDNKAIERVKEFLKIQDSGDRIKALDEIIDDLGLNLLALQLAHSRDNNLIKEFLERIKETKHWRQIFHTLVLKLTCNDDWNTLGTVLELGKDLGPVYDGDNPIKIASAQVSFPLHIFS